MSEDEIKQGIKGMVESGKIDMPTARQAFKQPLEGEKLLRLDRIEGETRRQSLALFGDIHLPGGVNQGVVKDVREIKVIVFKAIWAISGVVAFCTALLSILAIVIECIKK